MTWNWFFLLFFQSQSNKIDQKKAKKAKKQKKKQKNGRTLSLKMQFPLVQVEIALDYLNAWSSSSSKSQASLKQPQATSSKLVFCWCVPHRWTWVRLYHCLWCSLHEQHPSTQCHNRYPAIHQYYYHFPQALIYLPWDKVLISTTNNSASMGSLRSKLLCLFVICVIHKRYIHFRVVKKL